DERVTKVEQAPPASEAAAPDVPRERREQMQDALRQRVVEELQDRIAAHEKAPVDKAWASGTRLAISDALEAARKDLGHPEVELAGVDCRTDTCIASLRFPSYEAAHLGAGAFVTRVTQTSCATTALLPQSEVAGPVQVPLLFLDCRAADR